MLDHEKVILKYNKLVKNVNQDFREIFCILWSNQQNNRIIEETTMYVNDRFKEQCMLAGI